MIYDDEYVRTFQCKCRRCPWTSSKDILYHCYVKSESKSESERKSENEGESEGESENAERHNCSVEATAEREMTK